MSHNYERAYIQGHQVNLRVGGRLKSEKINCVVPALEIAKSPEEWRRFTLTEKDIILEGGDILEVKEINQHFTEDPTSWPFYEVIVDTVSGYDAKPVKPIAYIFVSKKTGHMLTMATEKPRNWKVIRKYDQYRDIEDDFYFAPKSMLRPMSALIKYLKERKK
jgi:hypothetical protein